MSRAATYRAAMFRSVLHRAAALSWASVGRATTLARMSVAKMSQAAQVIVRARCLENSTGWDAGRNLDVHDLSTVEEVWQGSAPARITVRLLGGRVGNLTSSVSGVPRFRAGEEVVLFLEPNCARRFFRGELGARHVPHSP